MYKAMFHIDVDRLDEIAGKLKGIKLKDVTFKYDIVEGYEKGYVLIIFDSDKDRLHKRAMWIFDKVFNKEGGYVVR